MGGGVFLDVDFEVCPGDFDACGEFFHFELLFGALGDLEAGDGDEGLHEDLVVADGLVGGPVDVDL